MNIATHYIISFLISLLTINISAVKIELLQEQEYKNTISCYIASHYCMPEENSSSLIKELKKNIIRTYDHYGLSMGMMPSESLRMPRMNKFIPLFFILMALGFRMLQEQFPNSCKFIAFPLHDKQDLILFWNALFCFIACSHAVFLKDNVAHQIKYNQAALRNCLEYACFSFRENNITIPFIMKEPLWDAQPYTAVKKRIELVFEELNKEEVRNNFEHIAQELGNQISHHFSNHSFIWDSENNSLEAVALPLDQDLHTIVSKKENIIFAAVMTTTITLWLLLWSRIRCFSF